MGTDPTTTAAPRRYRRKAVPDIEAMRVTESAEDAAAIRKWIEASGYLTKPNTAAMRPGCVCWGSWSWGQSGYAPPGDYVVRDSTGAIHAMPAYEFEATYEPA